MTDDSTTHVVWSLRARRDLESIRAYIGQFAPLAAQRFALKLVGVIESLDHQPSRGRRRDRNVRELVIIRPYIVRYRLEEDRVVVLRIRHGARRGG